MKNTREAIKIAAVRLFNTRGLEATSLRDIAGEAGISPGNLTYHFKQKQDLIEALYFDLVDRLNTHIQGAAGKASVLSSIHQSAFAVMQELYAYRFLLRDLYRVMQAYPAIRTHFIALQQYRTEQFLQVFQLLTTEGLMRAPEFEGEYERLHERMNIFGDNWINALELLRGEVPQPVEYYTGLMFEMVYPYLTEKGKQEYNKLKDG